LSAPATGTQFQASDFSVYHQFGRMDIGRPLPIGAPFRMGDIVSELDVFSAEIALHLLENSFDGYLLLV